MQVPSADKKISPRRLHWLVAGTALVIAAIVGANALIVVQLHQITLRGVQNNLLRQSLDLSELVERTLQATDLMLTSVAERAGALASAEDGTQQLESEAFHILLKEKMSGLPQIHALGFLDANGMRLNHWQTWPAPKMNASFLEYFQVLKSNPKLASYLDAPVLGPVTGAWVAIEARPVLAKDGRFFGVVYASTDMKYFQAVSLDVDGRRICVHAHAQRWHFADALSNGWSDRNESAGYGSAGFVRFTIGGFARDQSDRR